MDEKVNSFNQTRLDIYKFIRSKLNLALGKKHFKTGKLLWHEKKYFQALNELEKAYQNLPDSPDLKRLMDAVLFKVIEPLIDGGQAARAKEILLKYSHIKEGDTTQSTLNNLSWACYKNKEYQEALKYSIKGLEMGETDFFLYCNKGNALLGLERYEEAIEAFDLAIKYDKNNFVIPLYGKGVCLYNLKKYEEAEQVFKKYLSKKNNENVYSYLIECFIYQRKYEENVEFINCILEKCFNNAWYHYKLGYSLLYLSSYHAAIEAFDNAIYFEPDYGSAYYCKCRIYCRFKIFEGAFHMLKKAIEIDNSFKKLAKEDEYLDELIKFNEIQELIGKEGKKVNA